MGDVSDANGPEFFASSGARCEPCPLASLATLVGSMRDLGVRALRVHPDGSVAEVELGEPPAPDGSLSMAPTPPADPLEARRAQAASIRRAAVGPLGGLK